MPIAGIKVLLIGQDWAIPYETKYISDSAQILGAIAAFQPDVVVTSTFIPGALKLAHFEIRKRWIHVDVKAEAVAVGQAIENCYLSNLWARHQYQDDNPLISIYTGTYNTGDYLSETYRSLKEQTYSNWEWVVVDDHSLDRTWERLEELAKEDVRVRPFKSGKRNEKIGAVKDLATRLCLGEYLVELDHDDQLTDFALEEIKKAFKSDPKIGFVYSNCANYFEDGSPHRFGKDGFWDNRYRETEYRGKKYLECIQPDGWGRFDGHPLSQWFTSLLYGPNHVRAYKKSFFDELGGYNKELSVADDLDLFMRAFLASTPPEEKDSVSKWKVHLLDKMIYTYRFRDGWGNATFKRNKSIQDHVQLIKNNYFNQIKQMNERRLAYSKKEEVKALIEKPSLKDISFIVLEAVETPLTFRCIESIREYAPGAEIVLVANGIKTNVKADKLLEFDVNLGFAAGCNAGADVASRSILCFLNNDCAFVDETPAKLLQAMTPLYPIVAPFSNRAKPPQGDVSRERTPQEDLVVPMVVGMCMMVPKVIFKSLCGFDPDLLTYEDDDFCSKAGRIGRQCKVVGGAWVEHERHETFNKLGLDVNKVMAENKKIFERKNPVIRVIVIAKNEERALPGFFAQWLVVTRDWCVLDTGSTDKTVEIAGKLGCKVVKAGFDDFAAARNEAIKTFGSGADWIIMIDPDERLDLHTIHNLRSIFYKTDDDILYSKMESKYADGSRKSFVSKPFAWRNIPGIEWVFKVHEKLVGSPKQAVFENSVNTHLIELHEDGRRHGAEGFYGALMNKEPYFTDASYKSAMLKKWPILDYDRPTDDRIKSRFVGPLISVVIPTFDRHELLKQAVASALAQDYTNIEILIVGDRCPAIEKEKMDFGPKVKVFNLKHNHGAGGAVPRNHAIAAAGGRLIAYLDDDNKWEPHHLSSLYKTMSETKASFVFSSMKVDGVDLGFKEPRQGGIDTSCILHTKELIEKHGGWKNRQDGGYNHDWELVSRWVKAGESWANSGLATLIYNVETCGQKEYLKSVVGNLKGVK